MPTTPDTRPTRSNGPVATASPARRATVLARHPITAFITAALGIGWLSLGAAVATELPLEPFLLVANFVGLLGTAVVITARTSGRAGVRVLFAGVRCWRIGLGQWVLALLALPTATLVIAAVTGTLVTPDDGWPTMALGYLTGTVLMGTLLFNIWEEVAWAGFVQTRLTRRHGLYRGAALTALPFAAIHAPLAFAGHPSPREAAETIAVLLLVAVVFRTLAGLVLEATGGSILVVAVIHASFNASGQLTAVNGHWQELTALAVLTTAVALLRRQRVRARRAQPTLCAPPN